MKAIEIINDGAEQSIHLPADLRIEAAEVFVKRIGRAMLLIPADTDPWQMFNQSLDEFTDDFMQDRNQPIEQNRTNPFG